MISTNSGGTSTEIWQEHLNGKKLSELLGSLSTPLDDTKGSESFKGACFLYLNDIKNIFRIFKLRSTLKRECDMSWKNAGKQYHCLKMKSALIRRKNLLSSSQKLLDYWHVVHIPLAVLMFTIMFIHIAAYYVFRPCRLTRPRLLFIEKERFNNSPLIIFLCVGSSSVAFGAGLGSLLSPGELSKLTRNMKV